MTIGTTTRAGRWWPKAFFVLAACAGGWWMARPPGGKTVDRAANVDSPSAFATVEVDARPARSFEAAPAAASRPAARTPVPAAPAARAGAVDDRSFAPLPLRDDHVDPQYQGEQGARLVALGRKQLPQLEARSQALDAAGDKPRAAEVRFRVQRLRAHLAEIEARGNAAPAP